ncbi:MAG: POTRA domain-containing protein, partial [Planctomycetota bacterium]
MRVLFLLALAVACAALPKRALAAKPEESAIEFVGIEKASPNDLKDAAKRELEAFFEHDRRPADASDAAWSMELHLREEGYAQAKVGFRIEKDRLVFEVQEGPRAEIGSVVLTGVRSVKVEELLRYFDYPDRPVFRYREVEAGAQKVEHHYLLRGYYRVKVHPPEVHWNADQSLANVTVAVEEGLRYVIRDVAFEGIDAIELDLVGEPYHVRRPSLAAARVRRQLREEGRQFAKVAAEAILNEETGAVTIRVVADPGP